MTPAFPKTDLAHLFALPDAYAALAFLAVLRFVTFDDLARVGLDQGEIASLADEDLVFSLKLQRRLTDEGHVDVLALKRAGAQMLASVLGVDAASIPYSTRSTCKRSAMFLDHGLALSRFALYLASALWRGREERSGQRPPLKLLSFETDAERLADSVHVLSKPNGLVRQPLVADALAVVESSRGPEGLLIEIDRGTESPSYLGRKYAGYHEWWQKGGPKRRFDVSTLRLLTVAPNKKRTRVLRETCREVTGGRAGGLFWFSSEDDIVAEGALSSVWSNVRSEHLSLWP
ncbi:MAG: hypothetical protein UT86_C0001G0244 [Candidatus Magasanikbacteria bacterium GW2011_GWC2_40_17]|uniref:Uncharacterized protein n=1 Tax=Candidatus Magasanikbacteria bacterium GW2011_GWA2_42_32 TaxID=1619039 RepID=A0A0G1A9H1_9BACT|nr:MAG: hypothetical protein UT86_C0001G0244 [Candidatus Magasanikbacteria bacterium GW2011_GWC2_40_17]KKS57604.1 MAG: hypothetical protein UV20_C0001G0244 [Candidatus Magasanikbacteria bacterium GW2011_GWA2_42_32]